MVNKIENVKIAVIGLGYVGLPLAVAFSKKYSVIGYDLDKKRIEELEKGYDRTNEITRQELLDCDALTISHSSKLLKGTDVFIVTVPTPVDQNNKPNLSPLESASSLVSKFLSKGSIVIYESTVFPGCTEEICVPILEKYSNLKYNREFFCGYSPERINPADKEHRLTDIIKITSGSNDATANFIDLLYNTIITAGTYKVSSIAVAEAAKVIENTQRDVNIALVNELSIIFNKLDLDTTEILKAASTKWNFLNFSPGLVGGHCIGVDPYYLTHKAIEIGYHPEIILAGRRINDAMDNYIAEKTIEKLVKQGVNPINAKISILGLTFKENCPDLRNTKIIGIIDKLSHYQCQLMICDDWVDKKRVKEQYGYDLVSLSQIIDQDAIIVAVAHDDFRKLTKNDLKSMLNSNGLLVDVKSIFDKDIFLNDKMKYWRL